MENFCLLSKHSVGQKYGYSRTGPVELFSKRVTSELNINKNTSSISSSFNELFVIFTWCGASFPQIDFPFNILILQRHET